MSLWKRKPNETTQTNQVKFEITTEDKTERCSCGGYPKGLCYTCNKSTPTSSDNSGSIGGGFNKTWSL